MKRIIFAALSTMWTGSVAIADVWTGTGSLFDGNRNLIATYDLTVNTETGSDGSRNTAIKVSLPNGSEKLINCQSSGSENKWSKVCDDGMAGGGYYFEKGLISEYVENAGGTAHATTVIFDSDDSMRLLRTELSNGDATRFFVESLTKVRSK
jgi:hypothetical protein